MTTNQATNYTTTVTVIDDKAIRHLTNGAHAVDGILHRLVLLDGQPIANKARSRSLSDDASTGQ